MNKEEIASRIKELVIKYKEKKEIIERHKNEFEKVKKHRKVKRYVELGGLINILNKDMQEIIREVAALERKFKE